MNCLICIHYNFKIARDLYLLLISMSVINEVLLLINHIAVIRNDRYFTYSVQIIELTNEGGRYLVKSVT